MLLLLVVSSGDNWDLIMYDAMRAVGGGAALYFMLWVVVATSLDAMLFYTSVELTWCDAAHPGPRPCPSNPCTRRPPSTLASPP